MIEPSTDDHLKALFQQYTNFRYYAKELYTFSTCQMLEWPALSCEWLPDRKVVDLERDYTLQYVAVGTQALPGSQNYVNILEFAIPIDSTDLEDFFGGVQGDDENVDPGLRFANVKGHSRIEQTLLVDSQVLKVRAMPQSNDVIAVKLANGFINVYDSSTRPKAPTDPSAMVPDVKLRGHRKAGFGLDWHPVLPGTIASGSDDFLVLYWDINAQLSTVSDGGVQQVSQAERDVKPVQTFEGHRDIVHDVSWHGSQDHLLASCSEDRTMRVWDTRVGHECMYFENAHRGSVNAVQFHPLASFQIATGGSDRIVKLWDMRKPEAAVHQLVYHSNSVISVQWAPFSETVLASSGCDRRVVMWDVQKINLPPTYNDDEYAPPELSFVHTGHLSRVTDISWNCGLDDEWLMASTDMTNTVQIYKPKRDVVYDYVAPDIFDVDNGDA